MTSPPSPDRAPRAGAADLFGRDLRLAVRSLLRAPGFLATAVLSLAVAIGASAAAFSVLDAVRFRALPFPDGERLVVLSEVPVSDAEAAAPARTAARGAAERCTVACEVAYETFANVLRTHPFRSLDAVAGFTTGGKALGTGSGEPLLVFGGVVTPNLFDLLGVRPVRGRPITADDDRLGVPLVTVLGYDLWQTAFGGDPSIIGRTVKLSDSHYTVVGIMPPGFKHEVRSQFWLPVVPTLDPSTRPSIRTLTAIGRLRPGATIAQLRSELAAIDPTTARAAPPGTPRTRLEAQPLRDRYASSARSHDVVFAAVVACVLLIACANLANLVLVRALHQQREFAIRSALGAGTGRLARALLAQHLVLVVLGAALGLLLARWSLGVLDSLAVLDTLRPAGMEYRIDVRVAAFAIALATAIGALLSVVPARVVARSDVQHLLREGAASATGGRWGSRAQRLFVVAQVASAVVLLVGAGLLARTVARLSHVDLGFDAEHVVEGTPSFPHPWRVKEKYLPLSRQIVQALRELPGVRASAIRAAIPLGVPGAPSVTLQGQASPLGAGLAPEGALAVSDDYFATMGIALARGRAFDSRDRVGTVPVVIVNEWAARRWWPGEDAVGKTFRVDTLPGQGVTLTVVGVARDGKAAQRDLLLGQDAPEVYRPYEQAPSAFPSFYVRTGGAAAPLLKPVRELLARLVPDRPVQSSWLAETAAQQLRGVRTNALQVLGFALVGFLLALVGIHGVLSYAVGRRTREIGIRGALGASRGTIGAMVLGDAAKLVLLGLALGLPVAAAATRLIERMLYGTRATDPVVYAAVALAVAVVALVASWIPARRAARVDPIVALRGG